MSIMKPDMTAAVAAGRNATREASGTSAKNAVGAIDTADRRKFKFDERYIAPIMITVILLVGQYTAHLLDDYRKTVFAIVTSIATELILGRLFTGKWPHLASAYVSGISVGILLRSPEYWPFAMCAAISVASKYVIRIRGRHLWNPSNLGIVCMLLLAPQYVYTLSTQFSNTVWPMLVIWTLGAVIIYRLKRFHICATYIAFFVFYAFLRSALSHDAAPLFARFKQEIAPITGPMYQLFIFFMITDPKTTVKSKKGQMLVAFLVATAENVFRMYGSFASFAPGSLGEVVSSHAPYFALTLMGPSANLIEILRAPRKPKPAQV